MIKNLLILLIGFIAIVLIVQFLLSIVVLPYPVPGLIWLVVVLIFLYGLVQIIRGAPLW